MFTNRDEVAERLAGRLVRLAGKQPLVLGIPRGGVPIAATIARALGGDLDVVLVRKLSAPMQPEYAIGAVSESGRVNCSERQRRIYGDDYVNAEAARQLSRLQERRRLYTPSGSPLSVAGRVVIVADDGSATGATMEAALRVVSEQHPAELIAALGVAPPDVPRRLSDLADDIVCLATPADFQAVGQYYRDFRQVDDQEVIALLRDRGRYATPP